MDRTYIKDLKQHLGKTVKIQGWVHSIRNQGGIKFILIRDVTGIIQTVVFKTDEAVFKRADTLNYETVVSIMGNVKEEKQAPGGFEVQIKEIELLSQSEPELPIPVVPEKGATNTSQVNRFDMRWLDLRQQEKLTIFKVWTALEAGFREYWRKNHFIQIYTPSFMSSASESGAEVFEVEYFDRKAYLAQSPQFYKQMAMAAGFERVFMVGPVFRAEPSYTTRHMTEFTGWDFEVSFIESHYDVMNIEEDLLISGFLNVNKELGMSIKVPSKPFPKITLTEAKKQLAKAGVKGEKADNLNAEEEKYVGKWIEEEKGSEFVWLIDYPISARPFYHMRHEDQPQLTKSFDLLYKGIEITTGAQREHRPEILKAQALEAKMDVLQIQYYIDFFRFGCPPHGGVGIGPGRIIMMMLDLPSVKEATFLPRDVKRLTP